MSAMPFGSVSGVETPVSRFVLGTVALERELDESRAFELLDTFVALGANAVDTARHYGDRVEGAIGKWMRERRNREQLVLIGKAGHPGKGRRRITRQDITADIERSLELLGTDYLDLLFLHRDDPSFPAGEIVEWLNDHQRAGRIRAFGGSNWTTSRLHEANTYAAEQGLTPFAASSPQLSLARPVVPPWEGCVSVSDVDLQWYVHAGLPLFAWSAQAQGFFAANSEGQPMSPAALIRTWFSVENLERRRRVHMLSERINIPPTAVALAWLLNQPLPIFAIIGPRSPKELQESAQALELHLDADAMDWLDLLDTREPEM